MWNQRVRDVDPGEVAVGVETLRSFQLRIVGNGGTRSSKDERTRTTRVRVQKRKMRVVANLSMVVDNLSIKLPSLHLCSTKETFITTAPVVQFSGDNIV